MPSDHSGFIVGPDSIINIIRDNLTDRYRDAYAVLKELIQNSDDARASRMEIGWSKGLGDEAEHPLLAGPAIFIVNDGPFDDSDAEAIRQIRLSNKSASRDKIGQFGLGMKSVFHFCEAFLYLWSSSQRTPSNGNDVLNPWGELCHTQWNEPLTDADQKRLTNRLAQVLPAPHGQLVDAANEDWFVVWLPLRRPEHSEADKQGDLIIRKWFTYDSVESELFDSRILGDLPTLLPLLRNLESVRVWREDGERLQRVYGVNLESGSERCRYKESLGFGEYSLTGAVRVVNDMGEQGGRFIHAGHEVLVEDSELDAIKGRDDWLETRTKNRQTGLPETVKTKGEPHAAVYFSIDKTEEEQQDAGDTVVLRIRKAAFLPLDRVDDELLPAGVSVRANYTLTLHGWFFVDSGRQHIDLPSDPEATYPTGVTRQDWNLRLLDVATLPAVIPALKQLAEHLGPSHPHLIDVTDRLAESELYNRNASAICQVQQWLMRVDQNAASWQAVDADQTVVAMPGGLKDRSLAFATFRYLNRLCDRFVVTMARLSVLRVGDAAKSWEPADVVELLNVDTDAVFADAKKLEYLARFVEALDEKLRADDRVQARLTRLIRMAVTGLSLSDLRELASKPVLQAFQRLIRCLEPGRVLPIEAVKGLDDAIDQAVSKLAGGLWENAGVIPLPKAFCEGIESIKLESDEAKAMLVCVSKVQDELTDSKKSLPTVVRGLSWIARQILLSCPRSGSLSDPIHLVGDAPLFPALVCSEGDSVRRVGIRQLLRWRSRETLFSGSAKVAKLLRQATADLEFAVVDTQGGARMFDGEFQERLFGQADLPACDGEAIAAQFQMGVELVDELKNRLELFEGLAADPRTWKNDGSIASLRYLLHAQQDLLEAEFDNPEQYEDLLVDTGVSDPAWRQLLRAIIDLRDDPWRLLPGSVTRKLTPDQVEVLGIRQIDQDSVIGLLVDMDPKQRAAVMIADRQRRRALLTTWPEPHAYLLPQLAIHETSGDGRLVAIDDHTFIQGDYQLPEQLYDKIRVVLIKPNPEYDNWANRGHVLVETFNVEQAVREVLELDHPQIHWRFIFDALESMGADASPDTIDRLKTTPWLPLEDGSAIAPRHVVHLPHIDDLIDDTLPEDCPWRAYVRLDKALRDHVSFPLTKRLLPDHERAAEIVFEQMSAQSHWCIGEVDLESSEQFDAWIEAFDPAPQTLTAMPVVRGVIRSIGRSPTRDLVELYLARGSLGTGSLVAVLELCRLYHASLPVDQREPALSLYDQYLQLACEHEDAVLILKQILLLNRQGQWVDAKKLCLNSPGVSRASLLNVDQERVVAPAVRHLGQQQAPGALQARAGLAGDNSSEQARDLETVDRHVQTTVSALRAFFEPWEKRVSPAAIGGLFCFLGDHPEMQALAESYVKPATVQKVQRRIRWVSGKTLGAGGELEQQFDSYGHKTQLERRRFLIHVVRDKTTTVSNLFGEGLEVNLASDYDHLILNHVPTRWIGAAGGIGVTHLQLRVVPKDELVDVERCRALLAETIRYVLEQFYAQRPTDEEISDIVDPDRDLGALSIRIVQNRLLDALPLYLQQISYRGSKEVKQYLDAWNRAEDARAEAELELDQTPVEKQIANGNKDKAESDIRSLRESMRAVLLDDENFQYKILQSVRARMHVAQYTPGSIPFELFQNADDAVAEWEEMRGEQMPLTPAHRRYVICVDDHVVRCIHWGRPINRARLGSFDGTDRRYQYDLLKMLTISGSDKSAAEYSELTTGRFGYGFKSVFLLSRQPRVISGPLGFRVVAGFYPDAIGDELHDQLLTASARWQDDRLDNDVPTVVELPLDPQLAEHHDSFLERFTLLMPLLPVFARQMDRVVLEAAKQIDCCWQPTAVAEMEHVWLGALQLPLDEPIEEGDADLAVCDHALALDIGPADRPCSVRLLLALGRGGVVGMDHRIPTLWVTAPTEECSGVGFALNAPFELHIARASLAPDSQVNRRLVDEAASRLGKLLERVFDTSSKRWDVFAKDLRLIDTAPFVEFWHSVWDRLGVAVDRQTGESATNTLIRRLLWGTHGAMRRLIDRCEALPSGLDDTDALGGGTSYRCLLRLDQPRRVVHGALADEQVFASVACWPGFAAAYPPGKLIHQSVVDVLKNLLGRDAVDFEPLCLAEVVDHEVGDGRCVDSVAARRIGALIDRSFAASLHNQSAEHLGDEADKLVELLQSVRFRARDGGWHVAEALVVASDPSDKATVDRQRAAFAPDDQVLHDDYTDQGLELFYACRYRKGLKQQVVAQWIARDRMSEQQQRAAVEYLIRSEDGDAIGALLRAHHPGSWISGIERSDPLLADLSPVDVATLMFRAGTREWESFVSETTEPLPHEIDGEYYAVLPDTALRSIVKWWRANDREQLDRYYRKLYPDGKRPDLHVERIYEAPYDLEQDDPLLRRGWLTLFMLGGMQTLGLYGQAQHRGFVELCQRRGWLDTFASLPRENAVAWINVLEEYFGQQLGEQEYLAWMTLYPRLYQFSRWLHHYVWWFKTLDSKDHFTLADLYKPATSPQAEGTEINAPPVARALGQGICLVVRELIRAGFLKHTGKWRTFCFQPSWRVRMLASRLRLCTFDEEAQSAQQRVYESQQFARHLHEELGEDADFGGAYDIPLQILAENEKLLQKIVG